MSITIDRTIYAVTLHARCDRCRTVAAAVDDTPGAAAAQLRGESWALDFDTAAAMCPACQAATAKRGA